MIKEKEVGRLMLLHTNAGIAFIGFIMSLVLLPKANTKDYSNKFCAYITTTLMLLIATSENIIAYPIPFYFMLGSSITSLYTMVLIFAKILKSKKE